MRVSNFVNRLNMAFLGLENLQSEALSNEYCIPELSKFDATKTFNLFCKIWKKLITG